MGVGRERVGSAVGRGRVPAVGEREGKRKTELNLWPGVRGQRSEVGRVTFEDASFLDPPAQDVHQPGHQLAEQREVVDVVDIEV